MRALQVIACIPSVIEACLALPRRCFMTRGTVFFCPFAFEIVNVIFFVAGGASADLAKITGAALLSFLKVAVRALKLRVPPFKRKTGFIVIKGFRVHFD